MRTTLDLPDPLMREVKARAALEGVKLKDYFAKIVQAALQRPVPAATGRSPVPVFHRSNAKPIASMSNAQLNAMMDAEEAASAARHAAQ
jgi:hypothetical protein